MAEPQTKFLLLSQPRSGSNWLFDQLNRLPGVTCYDELFVPEPRQRTGLFADYPLYHDLPRGRFGRRPSALAYVHRLYRTPGVVGFKMMAGQLRPYRQVWAYLILRRVAVVHLVRANLLEALVSERVAAASERWHIQQGEPTQDEVRVELDVEEVLREIAMRADVVERTRRRLARLQFRHVEVRYEDLVASEGAFLRLCEFLGLGDVAQRPQSVLVRSRTVPAAEVVKNYEEVVEALRRSRFAYLLELPTFR